ncbi:MAG: hypothetical protein ACRECW_18610 [Phyllobacterium sp.]
MTTTCLVGEIQSFLTSDNVPYKSERAKLALAQAQLADGSVTQALASFEELEAKTTRAQFLVSYAKHLIAKGDNPQALDRLREANSLLTDDQSDLDRLNVTGLSQLIAETFAQADSNEEGRAILDGIASYRSRIPMNPMLLALMLPVSKDLADIGFREEAATIVNETYGLVLDRELEITPEQALQIFEAWASLDAATATKAAEDLAAIIRKDGPSTFEFAIWTGLSAGLISSKVENTSFLERAQSSFAAAPERGAALLLVPKLSATMKQAGENEKGRALLDKAYTEAATLASPMEKTPVLLALAEGFARADDPEQAMKILKEILVMPEEAGTGGKMMRHYTYTVPAQLALLGKIDEAYDLAMKFDGGGRDMALMMAADKLAVQGNYHEAMRFLSKIEGDIAVMMMAGIAERIANTSNQSKTP